MFSKTLLKSVASAAAVGAALTVAQLSAPATISASPEIQSVACGDYPDTVTTHTNLVLSHAGGQYGTPWTATVRVSSTSSAKPSGTVNVDIWGTRYSYGMRLHNGTASRSMPSDLEAGHTYKVTASYSPQCDFKASGDTARYTVKKAGSTAHVSVRDIHRGARPTASIAVRSTTRPTGKVKLTLVKNGDVRYRETASLKRGAVQVPCRNLHETGDWTAKVVYLGTRNFKGDTARTTFTVKR